MITKLIGLFLSKIKWCRDCGRYTTHIKDKEGWYCRSCGSYN